MKLSPQKRQKIFAHRHILVKNFLSAEEIEESKFDLHTLDKLGIPADRPLELHGWLPSSSLEFILTIYRHSIAAP
jgi:hypothetical protein